ncbi:putative Replication P family protein [Vibrio nigripulchritudo SFn27]|uniref:Putative Replication P family protein n=1 Tax=Vibrio nigripulchritudo TaxID=28173 RepID=U4K559_9VIBR|nr:replication protein P [Vibrio nigripulchritudo]CCN84355.1 putative Replication P family protein [Vibrio nigripulchritudo BLFn1]CCN87144.1 putative Replication P family protein [Vibrio nigripulchritudo SFn27]CCN93336.1 putative Replication P family protein [Vibrio nigripulchritudo ENn2]CCO38569.1 putative Replication P family protein [Vibrio nigripulchritudo SFn135]CCO50396.1 putative Replication P family protein [Vibrio nigripulchritudo Wn13]
MKNVNQLSQEYRQNPKRFADKYACQPSTKQSVEDNAAKIVNTLFAELQSIFPSWRHALPDDETLARTKKTWTKAFIENQVVTQAQLQQGLREARRHSSPFFPSAGQFIDWCHGSPEQHGIPDVRSAYLEVCRHASDPTRSNWTHPALYVMGSKTGWDALKTHSENYTYPIFQSQYQKILIRVARGESFSDSVPKPLPNKPLKAPLSREKSIERIQSLRDKYGFQQRRGETSDKK